jgi:hypothetical protein
LRKLDAQELKIPIYSIKWHHIKFLYCIEQYPFLCTDN